MYAERYHVLCSSEWQFSPTELVISDKLLGTLPKRASKKMVQLPVMKMKLLQAEESKTPETEEHAYWQQQNVTAK